MKTNNHMLRTFSLLLILFISSVVGAEPTDSNDGQAALSEDIKRFEIEMKELSTKMALLKTEIAQKEMQLRVLNRNRSNKRLIKLNKTEFEALILNNPEKFYEDAQIGPAKHAGGNFNMVAHRIGLTSVLYTLGIRTGDIVTDIFYDGLMLPFHPKAFKEVALAYLETNSLWQFKVKILREGKEIEIIYKVVKPQAL